MELCDLYTSKLGRKSAKLRTSDTQEAIAFTSISPMIAPFGPSLNFEKKTADGARRLSLAIRCTDIKTLAFFDQLDHWAKTYLLENGERVLGKKMTPEQIAVCYKPCLRSKDGSNDSPLLQAKITLDSNDATRFWDEEKRARDPPELTQSFWQNSPALFRFSVPQLWIMAGQCGFLVNVTDCRIFSAESAHKSVECPI